MLAGVGPGITRPEGVTARVSYPQIDGKSLKIYRVLIEDVGMSLKRLVFEAGTH